MTAQKKPQRLIGWAETQARTGLGKTSIWRLHRAGKFPSPVTLPDTRRSVFVEDEVDEWIAARIAARDAAAGRAA